jgi:hypothetical protein
MRRMRRFKLLPLTPTDDPHSHPGRSLHVALVAPAWPLEACPNGIVTYTHWMRGALESQGRRVSVFVQQSTAGRSMPEFTGSSAPSCPGS